MSISYSGIVGFGSGKATLPSVDTWGSNMNILRDPPKSIQTKKREKVGETSNITNLIGNSGDRVAEVIQVYPRGVNPMVGVSFDNYGNNGGQKAGNIANSGMNIDGGSGKQAFLPYRIMDRGAFRPPIYDQRDLYPLSRLPREATSSFSQPGFTDYTKKVLCQSSDGKEYRNIKKEEKTIKKYIKPNMTYKIETPIIEPYEVKYVIKNPIQVSGNSGKQSQLKLNAERTNQVRMVENPLRPDYNINKHDKVKDIDITQFNTEKYTHDVLQGERTSNRYQNVSLMSLEDIYNLDMNNKVKDGMNINYDTIKTSYEKQEYIHNDINLERVLPQHQSITNNNLNIYVKPVESTSEREYTLNRPNAHAFANQGGSHMQNVDNISSRDYTLKYTVNAGGFEMTPSRPQTYHDNFAYDTTDQRTIMKKNAYNMQHQRDTFLGGAEYAPREMMV